jgi:hypothetical protein
MVNESFIFTARYRLASFFKARHDAGLEFGVFGTSAFFQSEWSHEFCHEPTGEVEERRKDKKKELHCGWRWKSCENVSRGNKTDFMANTVQAHPSCTVRRVHTPPLRLFVVYPNLLVPEFHDSFFRILARRRSFWY